MQLKATAKQLFKVLEKLMKFPEAALAALGQYPVCAFTDNKSLRSKEMWGVRQQRWKQKQLSEQREEGGKLDHSGAAKGKRESASL